MLTLLFMQKKSSLSLSGLPLLSEWDKREDFREKGSHKNLKAFIKPIDAP